MIAYLYMEAEGYITFDSGRNYMKFLVTKKLTHINEILTYDDGYLVIDTNYGEEYIDLNAIAHEIKIDVDFCKLTPKLKEA